MCSAILECWKGRTSCGSQSPFEHFIYTYIYLYNDIVQQCYPLIFSPKWCSFRFTPFLMFGKHKVWQPRVGKNLNWSKFHRAEGLGPCQDDTPFTPFFFCGAGFGLIEKRWGNKSLFPKNFWRKVPRFKHLKNHWNWWVGREKPFLFGGLASFQVGGR